MPNPDPAKDKDRKANTALVKAAIKRAAGKDSDGNPIWVGFAFSPGDKPDQHTFMMSAKKKGPAVSKLLQKQLAKDKDHKGGAAKICFGQATVGKSGGKGVIWIEYLKKLGGAERRMNEALKVMHVPFIVKLREEDDTGEAPAAPPAPGEDDENENEDTTDELEGADDADTEEDHADDEETEDQGGGEEEQGPAEDDEPDEKEGEQGEGEEQAPAQAASAAQPQPQRTTSPYKDGAVVWSRTRALMHANVEKFKTAVQQEYKDEPPALQGEINQALGKLDTMLQTFDDRLERSLDKAHNAADDATRKAELGNSKEIIKSYLKAMATDPLIAHLDDNPFGIQMNIKLVLTKSLTQLAKTVS